MMRPRLCSVAARAVLLLSLCVARRPQAPAPTGVNVRSAEIVVPCTPDSFDETLEWLCDLKQSDAPLLRVDEIFPAERPRVAKLSTPGTASPIAIRLAATDGADASAVTL